MQGGTDICWFCLLLVARWRLALRQLPAAAGEDGGNDGVIPQACSCVLALHVPVPGCHSAQRSCLVVGRLRKILIPIQLCGMDGIHRGASGILRRVLVSKRCSPRLLSCWHEQTTIYPYSCAACRM